MQNYPKALRARETKERVKLVQILVSLSDIGPCALDRSHVGKALSDSECANIHICTKTLQVTDMNADLVMIPMVISFERNEPYSNKVILQATPCMEAMLNSCDPKGS